MVANYLKQITTTKTNKTIYSNDSFPAHSKRFNDLSSIFLLRYSFAIILGSFDLGFLKTGTKGSAQGNFGLMDLVAGLHWLRENLPAFNGDATKITLMGHGTGASLANILMASPVTTDLIRRGILLSGSALSPWAIQRDPLFIKRKVAEQTGCHGDLIEDDLAPCLRTKSLKDLLAVRIETPRFVYNFRGFLFIFCEVLLTMVIYKNIHVLKFNGNFVDFLRALPLSLTALLLLASMSM